MSSPRSKSPEPPPAGDHQARRPLAAAGADGYDHSPHNDELVSQAVDLSRGRLSSDDGSALVRELRSVLEEACQVGRSGAATLPALLEIVTARHGDLFDRLQALSLIESLVLTFEPPAGESPG
ncbi:MAG TPA: hypothetical protein PKA20_07540 [Burkholderiaceae bacterium]|nr:hypothetical protein [Burkholderiaceae bacterium]